MSDTNNTEVIALAENFISLLKDDNKGQAVSCFLEIQNKLDNKGHDDIIMVVGKLALNISASIKSICDDPRLNETSPEDVASSIERLKSVAEQSEKSALETIEHVEIGKPLVQKHQVQISEFLGKLESDKKEDIQQALIQYFKESQKDMKILEEMFTSILMAQTMQDLSGQVINKALSLITLTQDGLIELIKIAKGINTESGNSSAKENTQDFLQAGAAGAIDDQGDIDDLLADLGI